jgi:hypothetical protein
MAPVRVVGQRLLVVEEREVVQHRELEQELDQG